MHDSIYVTINKLCNKKSVDQEVKDFLFSLNEIIPKMIQAGSDIKENQFNALLSDNERLSAQIDSYKWVIDRFINR